MMNIWSRLWIHIFNLYCILFFFSSNHFLVHSFIFLTCCPCYVVTNTIEEPKVAAVLTEPTTLIPVGPENSLSFSSLCVSPLLLLCPLSFFISLLKAHVMLLLRSVAC